ncbi:MAG: ABC transporter permease [Clostridiales bacterium]|nr:ABC transporter permease [Clostridiales bacterium]
MKEKLTGLLQSIWKPLVAVFFAVICSWLLLTAFGYPANEAFVSLWDATFGNLRVFGNTLNKACPLLFTGIAVAIGNRGSVFNIGAEGQFIMGCTAATWVGITFTYMPGIPLMILMVLAGALAGAAWAFIPGLLKTKFSISEIITTIMFNYIALQLVGYLVRNPMRDMSQAEPQSYTIAEQGFMPYLIEKTKLHPGFLFGCIAAVVIFILLFKTYFGYEVRAVGYNATAAKYGGINVSRTMISTMLISGALAGMGGAFEVAGSAHYLYEKISNGYGYTAIAVAILANNNPIGVILSSLLFGFLASGSTAMQRNIGVSSSFADIVQGIIIIFVAVAAVSRVKKKRTAPANPGKKPVLKEAKQ